MQIIEESAEDMEKTENKKKCYVQSIQEIS